MQECSGNIIYHAEEEQVEAALEYGAAPSLFTKGLPEALPTEAAVPKNWCARSAQGMLFWKEVWSWTKACSKLSRLFFPLDFAKPAVKKKMKIHFSPELCEKKNNVHNFLQDHCNRGTNSWETSALTSARMVLCLESEKNTFKKRMNCQNWQRILGHVVV